MFTTPSQLGLETLPNFRSEERNEHLWMMD
jgi:hypothetical protein